MDNQRVMAKANGTRSRDFLMERGELWIIGGQRRRLIPQDRGFSGGERRRGFLVKRERFSKR